VAIFTGALFKRVIARADFIESSCVRMLFPKGDACCLAKHNPFQEIILLFFGSLRHSYMFCSFRLICINALNNKSFILPILGLAN
jgi:hypothetical protein